MKSRSGAKAIVKLQELVDSGKRIKIDKVLSDYQITVFIDKYDNLKHYHYTGDDLIEAIMRIKEDVLK